MIVFGGVGPRPDRFCRPRRAPLPRILRPGKPRRPAKVVSHQRHREIKAVATLAPIPRFRARGAPHFRSRAIVCSTLLRIDAVVSPFGTGLIYITSTSRVGYGLARNRYIMLANKIDLAPAKRELARLTAEFPRTAILPVSALTSEGFAAVKTYVAHNV